MGSAPLPPYVTFSWGRGEGAVSKLCHVTLLVLLQSLFSAGSRFSLSWHKAVNRLPDEKAKAPSPFHLTATP